MININCKSSEMFNFAKLNDKTMKVQIINKSKHSLPQYATSSSAGWIYVPIWIILLY